MTQPETSPAPSPERRTPRQRALLWLSRVQFAAYTTLALTLLVLGVLWRRVFILIPPGHQGVMYRIFHGGTVTDRIWGEGLHVIVPWDNLVSYETRLQQRQITFDVLSDEGLSLGVSVSVRFRPNEDMLGYLHQDIGPDYFDRLIKPEVESHVRRTLGSRPAHEVYTSARDVLQELGQIPVLGRAEEKDGVTTTRAYVDIREMKLVSVRLPQVIEASIAEKHRQEQLMLEYRFKLEREEKEAERKRVEAAGIRDFSLIAGKITPDLLRWRSIDATVDLAKSPNAKVVVLGNGQGMPMILNVDGPGASPAPADAKAAPAAVPVAGNTAAPAPPVDAKALAAAPSPSAAPSASGAAPAASAAPAPTAAPAAGDNKAASAKAPAVNDDAQRLARAKGGAGQGAADEPGASPPALNSSRWRRPKSP